MSSLIYNKYSDCQVFNDIKVYLHNLEKKTRRCRSGDKIMSHLKQCEDAQEQLDIIKFRLALADQNAQVFQDYIKGSEIDNSDYAAIYDHQIKITLHLSPQILADFGMDGISSLVHNRCNSSFTISSSLRLPYRSLKQIDLNMYEKASKHDHKVREQIYDPNVVRSSPDDLPF